MFLAKNRVLELKRVGDGLAAEMVVEDNYDFLGHSRCLADSIRPRRQFPRTVEIIIAGVSSGPFLKPGRRVAAVETEVGKLRGHRASGPKALRERRLVNVAEGRVLLSQQGTRLA